PTVKKTTLLYNKKAGCFFKILNPLTLKNRILFPLLDKSGRIYLLSEQLLAEGVKVPEVEAYGTLGGEKRPIFVMKKIEGKSLYEILIREQKSLSMEMYLKIMDEVARFHLLGYWFGDAHLSHVFVTDAGVSGFIDIDSIRKNKPFSLRPLAKDLAGLNYPGLPFFDDEKRALLNHYLDASGIKKRDKFLRLLKHYTERRWKV
ncbi:MAG: hypothetical protein VST72_01965, partial [Nitrospirota bacterium]|nr:hypothetical protein [Nitrospirota bacterium]